MTTSKDTSGRFPAWTDRQRSSSTGPQLDSDRVSISSQGEPKRSRRPVAPSRRFPERTVARHVLRRGHGYYFRARHFLAFDEASTHICISLRTRDLDEARRRAARLEVVMADLQERAAQRLIEPGAIVECVRDVVTAFDDPGLSLADAERLARMVRERCDHADEVRLAKSTRLWDWAGDHIPPAAVDADLLEDHALEYREALASGDLTAGLHSVPDYSDALGLPDPSPLTRRMMARVILREMAASCERTAARYRKESVPYLDRSEPDDYEDTLELLDSLSAENADSSSVMPVSQCEPFPSDEEIAEWTSCRPINSEDDEEIASPRDSGGKSLGSTEGADTFPPTDADRSEDQADKAVLRKDGLDPSLTMIELWDRFAAEMTKPVGKWNADNARHSKAAARLWERAHPGLSVGSIQPRHAQELRRLALQLPSLHAKAVVWTQRPIREVVELFEQLPRDPDDDDLFDGVVELVETLEASNKGRPIDRAILSLNAWNRIASWLRAFGRWLVRNGLNECGEKVFGDLHVEADEEEEEKRRGVRPGRSLWTRSQAEALFKTPLFMGSKSPHRRHEPGQWITGDPLYWIVAIAATTGMRREEIAQLRVRHVREHRPRDSEQRIRYFDLRAKGLKLKNKESRRDIPIPEALVQLGVIEALIADRKPDEMLLGDITRNAQGRYGDVVGKAFGRYRAALPDAVLPGESENDEPETLNFGAPLRDLHAFRHSMTTWLIDADVGQPIAEELLGHRSPERRTALMGYDHGRRLERLKAAIDAVPPPFDPVRLRALRKRQCRPRVKVKANRRQQSSRMIEQTA